MSQPYDQNTLAHFKEVLLKKRGAIMARLQEISITAFVGELAAAEKGDRVEIFERHNGRNIMDQENLACIDGALKKIEDGSYGLCLVCRQQIPLEQLKVVPTALRCVPCSKKVQNNRRY